MSFRLQIVNASNEKAVISNLTEESTMSQLRSSIETYFSIVPEEQLLLVGFPPKEVEGEGTLVSKNIKSGARITVRQQSKVLKGVREGTGADIVFSIPRNSNGHMVRREMPGDNSCLFHSVAYTCLDKKRDMAAEMRQIAVELVDKHKQEFTTQVLGQPLYSYKQMILNPKMWGGAIELQVFSRHFETEIISFDYAYLREDHFGDGMGYKRRAFLIYTGQHYDAIVWAPFQGAPDSKDKTVFATTDEYAWTRARHYAEFLHEEAVKSDPSLQLQKEWRRDRDKRRAVPGHSLVGSD